jgi:hypothetical protein
LNSEPATYLKPSNNADPDALCPNGGSATDQNGQQEWKNVTSSAQIFTLAMPQPVTALNTLTIQLISHNSLTETDDNWNVQVHHSPMPPQPGGANRNTSVPITIRFHRWLANLRVMEVEQIKSLPFAPVSHPFVERLIGTIWREYLDRVFLSGMPWTWRAS